MRFASTELNQSVANLLRAPDRDDRICGANAVLESRVSDRRRGEFESGANPVYQKALPDYVNAAVNVTAPGIPATFHPANDRALLANPANQVLVRVEQLDWPLKEHKLDTADFLTLERAWRAKDAHAAAEMDKLFAVWNRLRDSRPMFAAFHDDVRAEAEAADWAERLRAQLGLGHLCAARKPVLVAQMRYTVKEVLAESGRGHAAFAAPTVLDSSFSPYFLPSPSPRPGQSPSCGRTVHLANGNRLVCEVLHRRITYRPEHMKKVFLLETAMPAIARRHLEELRRHHIERLRSALDCRHSKA